MSLSEHRKIRFLLFHILFCSLYLSAEIQTSDSSYSQHGVLDILFLGSATAETPWTLSVSSGFLEELNREKVKYNYHSEHLETARFDEDVQYDLMFRYLKEKFKDNEPEFFITAGRSAGHFAFIYEELFPNTQRILIHSGLQEAGGMLLVDAQIDYAAMVREMARLAEPRKVIVIGDDDKPSFAHRHEGIVNALRAEGLSFLEWVNLPLNELMMRVSELTEESIIFINPISRDFNGKLLKPFQVIEKIREKTSVPLFSSEEVLLGHGIVGGYLFSAKELGRMAGFEVLTLGDGDSVRRNYSGFGYYYDWREISYWEFEDRIEAGADIRYKELTLWSQYQNEIVFLVVIFILLMILVAVLVLFNRQLVKARKVLKHERDTLEERVKKRTLELSRLHEEAKNLARVDVLTGMYNRRAFFEQGRTVHDLAKRYDKSYAVMMLDIDFFKSINDRFGHASGDAVIVKTAEIVSSIIRRTDIAARIGGEEFAVILLETKYEILSSLAERIRREISENSVLIGSSEITVSISIGLADYIQEDENIDSVLDRADKALYQAKESGRNKVCFFHED